jgi:phenylacetate-CoA ligase
VALAGSSQEQTKSTGGKSTPTKSFEAINRLNSKDLEALQMKLLQKQLQHVYKNSRFYRAKFERANVKPSEIKKIEDLAKIPLTSREELEQNFQNVMAVPFSKVRTIRLSSGTTGSPLKIVHTRKDIQEITNASARRLAYFGITNKDIIQITSSYGLWQGAWSMHWGAEKIGACVIPVGPAETERQLLLIKQFGTSVLYAATNYHLRIAEVAKAMGEDLTKYNLRTAICVAEKPTKAQNELLKKEFGVKQVISDYGATEFPGFSANCKQDMSKHHVWADYYIVEIVDPTTHEPLPQGERGEMVLTSLQREAFPLVRYLTRDITQYFGFEKCTCGLPHPKISAEIDREDFMTKIRGVTVFPSHVEFLLSKIPELTGRCQLTVDKRTPKHETALRVETNQPLSKDIEKTLKQQIMTEIKTRVGFSINDLQFINAGQLETKYKKVIVET